MEKSVKGIVGGVIFGGLIGAGVGLLLFRLVSNFFGNLWSVEAGGPEFIVYSPFFVPLIVGLISGGFDIAKSILASIFSGIAYIICGIIILGVGGIICAGWGGITLLLIVAGLFCGGGTIIVIIFG